MKKRKLTLIVDDRFVGDPASALMFLAFNKAQSVSDPQVAEGYKALTEACINARVEVIDDEN